eukprot:626585-Amphidinium_carterae.1
MPDRPAPWRPLNSTEAQYEIDCRGGRTVLVLPSKSVNVSLGLPDRPSLPHCLGIKEEAGHCKSKHHQKRTNKPPKPNKTIGMYGSSFGQLTVHFSILGSPDPYQERSSAASSC